VRDVVARTYADGPPTDAAQRAAVAFALDALGPADGARRVVLVDGRLASADLPVTDLLGGAPEGTPRFFAALNAVRFPEGVAVTVPPGETVEIVHVATLAVTPRAAYPRLRVTVPSQAESQLVERYLTLAATDAAPHLTAAVTEVVLEDAARLDHTRVVDGEVPGEAHLATLDVSIGRSAYYAGRAVALGGSLTRLETTARFTGKGAECVLDGVYHVDGTDHVDHQVLVDHADDHGQSNVTYRGLLDGRGHAVFNAIGVVRPGTVGSSAHQETRNLLLSDEATLDTKPHLEIDSDDVTASHGSAVGSLDEEQLFYLRSRAIPEQHARALLTFAFVTELLERIPDARLASELERKVVARLPHGEALEGAVEVDA
jgi:Fe-S cluster assembly protein SufD